MKKQKDYINIILTLKIYQQDYILFNILMEISSLLKRLLLDKSILVSSQLALKTQEVFSSKKFKLETIFIENVFIVEPF